MSERRKPNRQALLRTLTEVQGLVGEARNEVHNDRNPERAAAVDRLLAKAFDLCVDATSEDPPR